MENQSTYRIRTKLGENKPINIPISLMQEYNSFEILSLKMNVDDNYNSYTSTEGIVIGRVSTANNGLGIPNVRVSIFVPKGTYSQTDEEAVLYPFSSPTDLNTDRVRYNLLPSESDVDCYQVIGTLPTKRKLLDNETVCEVFEKYYKYTTITNEAGDFMLSNIPVGKQRIHIDADLSDIGPYLSQRPYDMIENLGFEKSKFESTRQFKQSSDLDSLAQVISQNKSVHVYPYWGDITEHSSELKITRTDLSLNYDFKTNAIFLGSVITDKQGNGLGVNCTTKEKGGKMSELVAGPGRIEMIRKTIDNKVEQYKIKGDELINENGVWCYMIPMNLDYVRTDEYGNIVPTDDPNKGVPTRARVRFRISLTQMDSDTDAYKRSSYLVPNNPKITDEKFLRENECDYSFGSDTWDESFVDLFWNKVYSVKNYIPQLQKSFKSTNKKFSAIKAVNHFGDNNPFPYNWLSIKLTLVYRLLCVIIKIVVAIITGVNGIVSTISLLPCALYKIGVLMEKTIILKPIGKAIKNSVKVAISPCIAISAEFCDDGINKNVYYPGCYGCSWYEKTRPKCQKEQFSNANNGDKAADCITSPSQLYTCVENELAQQNEVTSFNFSNDWINGCLYMPLWTRHIKPKKKFFFGLFKRRAKDEWCGQGSKSRESKLTYFCANGNTKKAQLETDNKKEKETYYYSAFVDNCGDSCFDSNTRVNLDNGLIVNRENMYGQTLWYYRAIEPVAATSLIAVEYKNKNGNLMTSKTLYATDIILLGSMSDCDLNGVPKFYKYLKGSTYNMPTDILFSDNEIEYATDDNGNIYVVNSKNLTVATGCDWGNKNEYGYEDGGLFYGIGCSNREMTSVSCLNLKRICELGVGLDETKFIENLKDAKINSETDDIDRENLDNWLRPDGFISYDEIIDFDYRSMFATMNYNNLKTKINSETGVREYDFRHLYIDNFDGGLYEFMAQRFSGKGKANYKHNDKLEEKCDDYLRFRYGNNPYFYDGDNKVNDIVEPPYQCKGCRHSFPKYANSFYFYFGLKEGKTAIDLFNQQYNAPCLTKTEEEDAIDYYVKANGWCNSDSDNDGSYDHSTYDGYVTFNLEDISLPCTMMLNSRTNASITYTVCVLDDDEKPNIENTTISDEKICLYGDLSKLTEEEQAEIGEYERYGLIYENSSIVKENDECYMLSNGEYDLYITDGEGNQHSYVISIKNKYLTFSYVTKPFGIDNNTIKQYYKTSGEKYINSPFNSAAKSPQDNTKIIQIGDDEGNNKTDEDGAPNVFRYDKGQTLVTKKLDDESGIRLNGTICIYDVYYDNENLQNFIIEVEPYDKDTDGNYIDDDFWYSEDEPTNTWFQAKHYVIGGNNMGACKIVTKDGKEYISNGGEKNYIYATEYQKEEDGAKLNAYIIKCPKGDINYSVKVTQLCQDVYGKWFKTNNYVTNKVEVKQPTIYKLYINDVDYDIIKNFKTGYELSEEKYMQMLDGTIEGPRPFKGFGNSANSSSISKIKGWLNISDINNELYDWSVNEELYGTNDLNGKTVDEVQRKVDESEKKLSEIKVDLETLIENESEYNQKMDEYNKEYEVYQELTNDLQFINNRLDFIEKMKTAFWLMDDQEMSISLSVRTDDTPYDVWVVYNEEQVSDYDNEYNETMSKPNSPDKRNLWYCKGESTSDISGIQIPTITSYNDSDFGIENDNIRQKLTETYKSDKTACFAQDNIAENDTNNGGVSIKPPYLVACVNSLGITKPSNLNIKEMFNTKTNSYGLKQFAFGDVDEENQGKVKSGNSEFFGFHIIDKRFTSNVICWSYINNVPYYMPWYDYNATSDIRLGKIISCVGIMSGLINNGVSSSTDENGYVDDFSETKIFSKDTPIKTFNGDDENSIPTRRCILYDRDKTDLTYRNYRFTTKVDEINQYRDVPKQQGDLEFSDSSTYSTTKELYGAMKISLTSNTVSHNNEDEYITLRVSCSGGDASVPIKYYLFRASQKSPEKMKGEQYSTHTCWYPLNAFMCENNGEERYKYWLDCKCDGNDESKWTWDGGSDSAQYLFNKNTTTSRFRDPTKIYNDNNKPEAGDHDLACFAGTNNGAIWGWTTIENSDGETEDKKSFGCGTTGVFEGLNAMPYFVIAVYDNGNRAISPVYDFSTVYYVIGLMTGENENEHVLRVALSNVLRQKGYDNENMFDKEGYGVNNKFNGYCKKPRNYYLTQYDFNMDYTFTSGSTTLSNTNISYKKNSKEFVNSKTELVKDENIGKYYVGSAVYDGGYYLYHNVGGTLLSEKKGVKPIGGKEISEGDYYYDVKYREKNDEGEIVTKLKYQKVSISDVGEITLDGYSQDDEPTDVTHLTNNVKYYVKYEESTETETGETTTTTVYMLITYSTYTEETVRYNPKMPHFLIPSEKTLTEDEYKVINDALYKNQRRRDAEETCKIYITDVTGLKHNCKCYGIVDENNKEHWKKFLEPTIS